MLPQAAAWGLAVAVLSSTGIVRAQVPVRFDAALHKELGGYAYGDMVGKITYNGLSNPSTATFTVDTGDIQSPTDTIIGGMGFASWGGAGWLVDVNEALDNSLNEVSNYLLEIKFKPLVTNAAPQFNVDVRDWDGFDVTRGQLIGDDHQYTLFLTDPGFGNDTDDSDGVTSTTDGNGFITYQRDLIVASADFVYSSLVDLGIDEGDRYLNLNAVATPGYVNDMGTMMGSPILGSPGGMRELQIQANYASIDRLHIEVEHVGFVPKTPGSEKARFDFRNTSFTFGSFMLNTTYFQNNASGNIEIDADGIGGAGTNNGMVDIDGTTHSLQITARVLGNNTSARFAVNVKDVDGDDSGPGAGGETYQLPFDTADFAGGGFVTVVVPLSDAILGEPTAFEFANLGDGDMTDLNIYQIQIANIADVLSADFDGSTVVDNADLAQWEAAYGLTAGADADGDGDSDGADFLVWQREFGLTAGVGRLNLEVQSVQIIATPPLAAAVAAVPEPGGLALAALGLAALVVRRRQRLHPC